jgi:hypothetical protein
MRFDEIEQKKLTILLRVRLRKLFKESGSKSLSEIANNLLDDEEIKKIIEEKTTTSILRNYRAEYTKKEIKKDYFLLVKQTVKGLVKPADDEDKSTEIAGGPLELDQNLLREIDEVEKTERKPTDEKFLTAEAAILDLPELDPSLVEEIEEEEDQNQIIAEALRQPEVQERLLMRIEFEMKKRNISRPEAEKLVHKAAWRRARKKLNEVKLG